MASTNRMTEAQPMGPPKTLVRRKSCILLRQMTPR
jgi:hypothetical protein